jgi:hypothetical protein
MFNIINEVNYAYAIIKFKASKLQISSGIYFRSNSFLGTRNR